MAVTIYEALKIIEENITLPSTKIIPIENAILKVSAEDLYATISLPVFNNSAMDGYALRGECSTYTIVGKILAGDNHTFSLNDGECVKILTGAKIPSDAQTVIPQENTKLHGNRITIEKPVKTGSNIRYSGEDIDENELILHKGKIINSSDIALLASQGITHIKVYRKPKIAVFASGSELKLHFETIKDSQIYNSNTPYLLTRSYELGCKGDFIGKSEDNIDSLKKLIEDSLEYDIILTSGGVSVGEADYTKEAFLELGMKIFFSKVEIKPGKPTTFGKIGNTLILNLPGNPLACAINFEIMGKFLINAISGNNSYYHNYIETTTTKEIFSKRPVSNVIAGYFDGVSFTPLKKQAPGMVNVLNKCNGIIIIDKKRDFVEKDSKVKFLPINWNFTTKEFKEFIS